jgi:hypothetical protein
MLGAFSVPRVVGVGKKPEAIASMGRTDVTSSQHAPSAVIPQLGKSFEDGAESKGTQVRTVFREDHARSYFSNDAQHLVPKS